LKVERLISIKGVLSNSERFQKPKNINRQRIRANSMSFIFKPRLDIEAAVPRWLLETMHEKALEVIELTGIRATNKRLLRRLAGHKGFRIEKGWVKIRSNLIEDLLSEIRRRRREHSMGDEELILSLGYPGCSYTIDLETDQLEPLTKSRAIEATKLVDSLHDWGVRGGAPGAPIDVPPRIRRISQCLIGYEYSRSASPAPFESYEEAVYIKRMAEVMGQGFEIPIYVVSPFRLEGISLDRAIPFLERGDCDSISISSMPMAGATAPVYPVGAFIQGISESLGAYAILHEAYPNIPAEFSIGAYHFDMRHGNIVIGSPEQTLMDLFSIALSKFYGVSPQASRSFRTMAKKVDIQGQVEKAASVTVGVLTGPGEFVHSGLLSIDEVFSPLQLVVDCEIARYLSRMARGLEFAQDQIERSVQSIASCAIKGQYLTHRTTLVDHRRIYWSPSLFDYSLLRTSKIDADIAGKAREICRRRIQEHEYRLEEEKRRKLIEIYKRASGNL
jgi:trimethylamine:corrinoid methyltransferase-like protein